MVAKLFVNLPVTDLGISRDFFQNTGFEIVKEFTNESSACIKFNESIYAMLLREESFEKFSGKKPVDISSGHEVINAIQLEERSEVDFMAEKALQNGATFFVEPIDHGFMYVRSFKDPDG